MQGHSIRAAFISHNMSLVALKFLTVDFEAYLTIPASTPTTPATPSTPSTPSNTSTTPPASPAPNTPGESAAPAAAAAINPNSPQYKQRNRRRATVTTVMRLLAELVAGSDLRVKTLTRFRAEHALKRLLMTCANPRDPHDHHLLYAGFLLLQLLLPLVSARLQGPLMPLVTMMYNHTPPLLPIPFVWPPPPPALPGTEADAPSPMQEQAEARLRTSIELYNHQLAATSQPTSVEVVSYEQIENTQAEEDYWIQLSASADEWLVQATRQYPFEQLFAATFPHLSD